LCHQDAEPLQIEQFRPNLPPEIAQLVRKLMAKDPRDRYQTPAHLAAQLATILYCMEGEQIDWHWRPHSPAELEPVTPPPEPVRPVPLAGLRSRPLSLLGGTLLAFLAGIILWAVVRAGLR
jgi:hypothetical protein